MFQWLLKNLVLSVKFLWGLKTSKDRPNVEAMKNGAGCPSYSGSQTLVDAVSECIVTGF